MSQTNEPTNNQESLGSNIIDSIFDRPIWETIGQKMKGVNVSDNARPSFGNPYFAGMGIGIALFMGFFFVGKGFGDSGALTRFFAYMMSQIAPSYTDTLVYFKRYLSTSGHPLFNWVIFVLLGSMLGGLISGMRGRRMKMEFTKGDHTTKGRRVTTALIGGVLVAFGTRIAGGCVTGLAINGGAVLSVAGWLFFVSLVAAGMVVAFVIRKEWL